MGTVSPLGLAHAPLLAALHRQAFRESWDEAALAGTLALPGAYGYIAATPDGAPAGFVLARVAADESEILTLLVIPGLRRQGWARNLVQVAQGYAAGRGATAMFLEVAANNVAAIRLYTAMGFIEVGRRDRYYSDGNDALVLQARLS